MQIRTNRLLPIAKQRLHQVQDQMNGKTNPILHSHKLPGMIYGEMDKLIGHDGRVAFFRWIFKNPGIQSSHDLTPEQVRAIVQWADPRKYENDWTYSNEFTHDLNIIRDALGEAETINPVMCTMCNEGHIERLKRDLLHPHDISLAIPETIICKCCDGNYTDCPRCRALGG